MAALAPVRGTALGALQAMLAGYGLGDLATQFAGLVSNPDLTDAQVWVQLYDLPAYQARFPGMKEILARGGATGIGQKPIQTEQDYMLMEDAYKQVLRNNGLPAGFHDSVLDFANFMTNEVSPDEVNKRILQAKRLVDSSDPTLAQAAFDYYGIDRDHLIAHALDPTQAQPLIDKQMQTIETGSAGAKYGFSLDRTGAENLVNDPSAGQLNPEGLRSAFSSARQLATQDARLSAIDQTGYSDQSAVNEVLLGNLDEQRASTQRAQREAGRFGGSNAGRGLTSRAGGTTI